VCVCVCCACMLWLCKLMCETGGAPAAAVGFWLASTATAMVAYMPASELLQHMPV
jgi:hypothetical protein